MKLGISPIVNFAFLKLFASEQNKLVLRAFLNAILKLQYPIVDLQIANPFNLQDFEEDKQSILDIKARDSSGRIFNVEMQLSNFAAFPKRIVFYGCEIYTDQLRTGEDYSTLNPVYCISICRGALWRTDPKVHHRFQLMDQSNGRVLRDTMEIHTLELEWYTVDESQLNQASEAERWLYLLLYAQNYEAEKLKQLFPELEFLQAIDTLVEIFEKSDQKAMYDASQKAMRDRASELRTAIAEGEARGVAIGEARGIAIGEARGIAIGEARGIAIGELLGKIRLLQRMLGKPEISSAEFGALDDGEVNALFNQLMELAGRQNLDS